MYYCVYVLFYIQCVSYFIVCTSVYVFECLFVVVFVERCVLCTYAGLVVYTQLFLIIACLVFIESTVIYYASVINNNIVIIFGKFIHH